MNYLRSIWSRENNVAPVDATTKKEEVVLSDSDTAAFEKVESLSAAALSSTIENTDCPIEKSETNAEEQESNENEINIFNTLIQKVEEVIVDSEEKADLLKILSDIVESMKTVQGRFLNVRQAMFFEVLLFEIASFQIVRDGPLLKQAMKETFLASQLYRDGDMRMHSLQKRIYMHAEVQPKKNDVETVDTVKTLMRKTVLTEMKSRNYFFGQKYLAECNINEEYLQKHHITWKLKRLFDLVERCHSRSQKCHIVNCIMNYFACYNGLFPLSGSDHRLKKTVKAKLTDFHFSHDFDCAHHYKLIFGEEEYENWLQKHSKENEALKLRRKHHWQEQLLADNFDENSYRINQKRMLLHALNQQFAKSRQYYCFE